MEQGYVWIINCCTNNITIQLSLPMCASFCIPHDPLLLCYHILLTKSLRNFIGKYTWIFTIITICMNKGEMYYHKYNNGKYIFEVLTIMSAHNSLYY